MSANTSPIFTGTPNVGYTQIPTNTAVTASDGSSTGSGNSMMYVAFTAGANGSFVDRVRFLVVASAAAVTSVATTLRVFLSTVASPGATTAANTFLLGEVSVPALSAANSTAAQPYYELPLGIAIPSGTYILVTQHVAQSTNQSWKAVVFGGNY